MADHGMALAFVLSVLVASSTALVPGMLQHKCEEFAEDVNLCTCETFGDWHLHLVWAGVGDGKTENICFKFLPITKDERELLKRSFGKIIPETKWDQVVLKLAKYCETPQVTSFFEKTGSNGSFINTGLKYGLPQKHTQLKMINGHLLMVDCSDFVTLVFGKRPRMEGDPLDAYVSLALQGLYADMPKS